MRLPTLPGGAFLLAVSALLLGSCQPPTANPSGDAPDAESGFLDGFEANPLADTHQDAPPDRTGFDLLSGDLGSPPIEVALADLQPPDGHFPETLDSLDTCDCPPPALSLTVNRIPAAMNGSVPFVNNNGQEESFTLTLPTFDFTINVSVESACGILPETIVATAMPADAPPIPLLLDFVGSFPEFSARVPLDQALPESPSLALSATVTDICGLTAPVATLDVATRTRSPALHPFDLEDWWLMVYHRDFYTIELMEEEGAALVISEPQSNGVDDFLEDLWLVGIGSPWPTAEFSAMDCGVPGGGNGCLAWELLARIRTKAYAPLGCENNLDESPDCIPLRFAIEGEADAPSPDSFAYETLQGHETSRSFSMIGFGGGDLTESLVGLSESLDVTNAHNENNAKFGYGCFTSSLMRFFYQLIAEDPSLYALAEVALSPILPPMGGVPIGEMEGDHRVADFTIPSSALSPLEKSRRLTLDTTVDILATGLAALMVHEIGHSVGLVPLGPPPAGLFGGAKMASFVTHPAGSTGPHIDTDGPNLMQSGPGSGNMNSLDVNMLLTPFFFNELNLAYLQGRVLVIQ